MTTRLDTTIRPICFGIDKNVSPDLAKAVGPEKFKRYEYVLYLMAQLSRIVYCDTGIMHKVIETSLGMSNDVVNGVISAYDWKFLKERRIPITSQAGKDSRPMESYSLGGPGLGTKYGTYVATPEDTTCLFLNTSAGNGRLLKDNSIFLPTDVIASFKGSSSMKDFIHDLKSMGPGTDLGELIKSLGIQVQASDQGSNNVTGSFVKPLVNGFSALITALSEHVKSDDTRLFITGQSLGGAYAHLFGFILAEAKVSNTLPIMQKIKSIHIISCGAPTTLSDNARNTFNRHLDSGLITLDRIVSQAISARSAAGTVVPLFGPNDGIPNMPGGFSHPGFRPLATEFRPEANGRPYSIDNIRTFYGVNSKTRYRDPATWPFTEAITLGDRENNGLTSNKELVGIVTQLTGAEVPPPPEDKAPEVNPGEEQPVVAEGGGLVSSVSKNIYSKATLEHLPNVISVQGSKYMLAFAHGEYLGMFFAGVLRLPGMKNPANGNNVAYFSLFSKYIVRSNINLSPHTSDALLQQNMKRNQNKENAKNAKSGVTIKYIDFKPLTEVVKVKEKELPGDTPANSGTSIPTVAVNSRAVIGADKRFAYGGSRHSRVRKTRKTCKTRRMNKKTRKH